MKKEKDISFNYERLKEGMKTPESLNKELIEWKQDGRYKNESKVIAKTFCDYPYALTAYAALGRALVRNFSTVNDLEGASEEEERLYEGLSQLIPKIGEVDIFYLLVLMEDVFYRIGNNKLD